MADLLVLVAVAGLSFMSLSIAKRQAETEKTFYPWRDSKKGRRNQKNPLFYKNYGSSVRRILKYE
ncbi:hypothetical protein HRI96_02080 [Treponema parvum]|uniref:Uncharacterized protein n=1 Tax=Treponema parvum TaxID=138851 RepID=A0A975EY26_9SPIR|nr:hypothetical protein [Treponema parvum]QTQ11081.1 hypothetical protein HRI96_02080 [Treponema parvum]